MLWRNAREEAQELLGAQFEARVLEPSPPAIVEGPWFADDPVAPGAPPESRAIVSPVPTGALTWDDWLGEHPEHSSWASSRWLGGYRRLPSPPAALAETRLALHRLAVYVVSPARRRTNGKIALRWTLGGFGTPFFGDDEQVRVAGSTLVRQAGDTCATTPVGTLAGAAEFVLGDGPDVAWAESFDVPDAGDVDAPLGVDDEAAAFLGDWYGFAWSVLEELRADPSSADASRVQLWPEHFDAAFDCLADDRRGTFGASPGDAAEPEPYLYVISPRVDAPSDVWNAVSFRGAILRLSEFVDAEDQRAAALAFFRSRRELLLG